jgi:hypothetical protein
VKRLMDRTVSIRVDGGIARASLNRIATRKLSQDTVNSLADNGADLASVGRRSGLHFEELAGLRDTVVSLIIGVVALVDGILENSGIPTVLEVTVPGVSSRVTSGVDEGPLVGTGLPAARKFMNVPCNLVEELHHVDWVSGRADTIVEAREIGDVGHVVRGFDVLAVPARGHMESGIEARLAVSRWEASAVFRVIVATLASGVTETRPLDGTFTQLFLRALADGIFLATSRRISSEHLEAGRERLQTGSAVSDITVSAVLIIDQESAIGDGLEGFSLGILEVKFREPVVGEILSYKA